MSPFLRPLAAALCGFAVVPAASAVSFQDDPDLAAGDYLQILNPLAALGVAAYKHDREGAWQLGYTVAATFAATQALKYAVDQTAWGERPNGGRQSFPSGHTSSACSGAAFLSERYGWQYGLPLYATALFTAYTRVDEDYHHWRDVIAGCALAYGAAQLFTHPYEDGSALSLAPMLGDGKTIGLQLRYDFGH